MTMIQFTVYAPVFIRGTLVTIGAWLASGAISLFLGTILGILSCRFFKYTRLQYLIFCYTFIAKGVPAYVQILMAYFFLPALLGLYIPGYLAALGALAFCSSGYVAEIVRSAIDAVSCGQWQACFVLGYSTPQTLTRIILPQAAKHALPALCGESEQLLKSTSLLATIGITELTRTGMNIISKELNPIPVYAVIACIYLLLSALLHTGIAVTQKKVYA